MLDALQNYIHDTEMLGLGVQENVIRFEAQLLHAHRKQSIQPGYLENPINAFHFIQRMHLDWVNIHSTIICTQCTLTIPEKHFQARLTNSLVLTEVNARDLREAANGIVRLWQTYKLHLPFLFRGRILEKATDPLTVDDILYICKQLNSINDFYKESVWLRELLMSMTNSDRLYSTKSYTLVEQSMAAAYAQRTKLVSKLHCIYRETQCPIYRAKEEILNYAPPLSVFYEVLTQSEIEDIKQYEMTNLRTSLILGETEDDMTSQVRVSQTAWLPDNTSEAVKQVANRVELITDLSTQQFPYFPHAEHFQVLNYGIGGMYEAHRDDLDLLIHEDPLSEEDPINVQGTGDRIATWIFYLNDVKAGGATVFLNLNITIPAVKGAAAFWYNIKRNGETDPRTTHAGCPVLLGTKWLANKWIRQHGQIFRRKCGKTINSLDLPL